jgi:hypothetical protein
MGVRDPNVGAGLPLISISIYTTFGIALNLWRLTANDYLNDATRFKCGSWLACDGGLTADQNLGLD